MILTGNNLFVIYRRVSIAKSGKISLFFIIGTKSLPLMDSNIFMLSYLIPPYYLEVEQKKDAIEFVNLLPQNYNSNKSEGQFMTSYLL